MEGVVATGIAVTMLEGEIERLKVMVQACQEEATKQTLLARELQEKLDTLRHENEQIRHALKEANADCSYKREFSRDHGFKGHA